MDKNTIPEIPTGLGMALGNNPQALMRFSALDIKAKQKLVDNAKQINSKQEMQSLVNNILQ